MTPNNPALDLIMAAANQSNKHLDEAEHNLARAREYLEGIIGRGPGDPDVHGYPGQPDLFQDMSITNKPLNLDEEIPF